MIGLCHLERDELEPAAEGYRQAIDAAADEGPDVLCDLRYELGEILLRIGDRDGALNEFLQVAEIDPDYRDVAARIAELQAELQT